MPRETWALYPNVLPDIYEDDVAAAKLSATRAVEAPGKAFDLLALTGDPLIYVITSDETLKVATQFVLEGRIGHAVLAEGLPVLAAGEVSLVVLDGYKAVIRLNNRSGHYRPRRPCLTLAADVFRGHGFEVPAEAIEYIQ